MNAATSLPVARGPRVGSRAAGSSKQDFETPAAFLDAVVKRFGALDFDLACTRANAKARRGFMHDAGIDALAQDWTAPLHGMTCFLNPPFARIAPWARKCKETIWRDRSVFDGA